MVLRPILNPGIRDRLHEQLTPMEYAVMVGGRRVLITRYDNHRRLIANGSWVAADREMYAFRMTAELSGRYANPPGTFIWRYKGASAFATPEDALHAAQVARSIVLAKQEATS